MADYYLALCKDAEGMSCRKGMCISCCLGPSATLELLAQLLRNARGPYVTTVPTTPMWSRGKAQATTNLLPFPQQLSVSQENCTTLHNT